MDHAWGRVAVLGDGSVILFRFSARAAERASTARSRRTRLRRSVPAATRRRLSTIGGPATTVLTLRLCPRTASRAVHDA